MTADDLQATAKRMVAPGKGILAADESRGTIAKRFEAIDLASNEELRRSYRELLITAPKAEEFISGVILYEESVGHTDANGTTFAELLNARGILPGVKVGIGNKPLPNFPGEEYTEGLDGLQDWLPPMRERGVRFTKWRAVLHIGDGLPTRFGIDTQTRLLARVAALSQASDLVPIVEPEVLMDGDHGIDACYDATMRTLTSLFEALDDHRVALEGIVLKTNMVLPGKDATKASPDEIAEATLRCFDEVLPAALPGVAFLSGGQSEVEATENLQAMNTRGPQPWELTFSYGRALLDSALRTWKGDPVNAAEAQKVFLHRARCNAAARQGTYASRMEAA
jgi:fructose-bisphosphate aldolase, class I